MKCKQCGSCCKEIKVKSGRDLYERKGKIIIPKKTPENSDIFFIGTNWIFVRRASDNRMVFNCPHLKNNKCLIQGIKPKVCANYPMYKHESIKDSDLYAECEFRNEL